MGDFNPYVNNGGTVLAAAKDNFAVLVADTRLSVGYSIHSRRVSKVSKLTDRIIIGTAGMNADTIALHKQLEIQVTIYRNKHHSDPDIHCVAQLLSTVLYGKRFFPYYTFNLLVGTDMKGQAYVFTYDAIGNYEPTPYSAQGTGSTLITSILDSKIGCKNQKQGNPPVTLEDYVNLLKDAISSAAERDIYTGDSAEIFLLNPNVSHPITFPLRCD